MEEVRGPCFHSIWWLPPRGRTAHPHLYASRSPLFRRSQSRRIADREIRSLRAVAVRAASSRVAERRSPARACWSKSTRSCNWPPGPAWRRNWLYCACQSPKLQQCEGSPSSRERFLNGNE
ncbi:hypothetical protein AAW01_11610 [Aurantiacibacter gangjinensis]|uniref:Uncharacterized protein n=1 Tax=Aurantiacibacter gangjinensis TaxID=502682 RepID=A0A0G9MN34_9SPHN|nr:hypothetical protein AAW01_11610 [Aurantiacibacter gangjinensis]